MTESPTISQQETVEKATQPPLQLFNPNPAASWSILLTPIFGAAIIWHNWKTIGNQKAQQRSLYWAIGLCIPYGLLYFTEWLVAVDLFLEIGLLLAWYLIECRAQVKYLKSQSIPYEKRKWLEPMGRALPIGLAVFILSTTLTYFAWSPVLVTTSEAAYRKSSQKVLLYLDKKHLEPLRQKERAGTLTEDDLKKAQAIQYLSIQLQNKNTKIRENYFWSTQALLDYATTQLEGAR